MKQYSQLIKEINTNSYRLKDVATVSLNKKDADFWITRRGTPDSIGKPTKDFNKESFGIKITRHDVIDPDFLYYAIMNIHSQGLFKNLGSGTTSLVSIKKVNIENIRIG